MLCNTACETLTNNPNVDSYCLTPTYHRCWIDQYCGPNSDYYPPLGIHTPDTCSAACLNSNSNYKFFNLVVNGQCQCNTGCNQLITSNGVSAYSLNGQTCSTTSTPSKLPTVSPSRAPSSYPTHSYSAWTIDHLVDTSASNVCADSNSNIYFSSNGQIFKYSSSTGASIIVGGIANSLFGQISCNNQNLYFSDFFANVYRRLDLNSGIISTFAGGGSITPYSGNSVQAIEAKIGYTPNGFDGAVHGIWGDSSGNFYITGLNMDSVPIKFLKFDQMERSTSSQEEEIIRMIMSYHQIY